MTNDPYTTPKSSLLARKWAKNLAGAGAWALAAVEAEEERLGLVE